MGKKRERGRCKDVHSCARTLEALYTVPLAYAYLPAQLPMLTTWPAPRAFMPGMKAEQNAMVPRTLASSMVLASATTFLSTGETPRAKPALLTRQYTSRNGAGNAAGKAATASVSVTDMGTTWSVGNSASRSFRNSASLSARRATSTNRAPFSAKRHTHARPIPADAPVINTTLSFRSVSGADCGRREVDEDVDEDDDEAHCATGNVWRRCRAPEATPAAVNPCNKRAARCILFATLVTSVVVYCAHSSRRGRGEQAVHSRLPLRDEVCPAGRHHVIIVRHPTFIADSESFDAQ